MNTLKHTIDRNIPHRTITICKTQTLTFPITRDYVDKDLNLLSNEELLQIASTLYSYDNHILADEDWTTSSVTFTIDD